ncbi:MAG: type II CAAX endopeptidase family protein [Eubacteriales bacterium]
MNNQIPNMSDLNNNRQIKPRPFYIFAPLVINYCVSIVVQLIFTIVLFIGVFTNYAQESVEFQELLVMAETETEISSMEEIEAMMSTELTTELTNQLLEAVTDHIALLTILCAVATIPVFLYLMKKDKAYFQLLGVPKRSRVSYGRYPILVVGSIALCIALNNILTLSQLAEISVGYQEASDSLYSISFQMQILGLCIITPIAEELVFRGVIYNRIKLYFKPMNAMLVSAMIFGLYHGNLVQMIYGGTCGFVLVWMYEKFGSLKAPILAHICLNLTSVVLTQYEAFVWMFSDQIRMTVVTVLSATLAALIYVMIENMERKNLETI